MSESTGIIFNDEMNDFSIPAAYSEGLLLSEANFIAPGKNPMSSMSPVIILNEEKEAAMIVGGAGGVLIMTTVIQLIIYFMYLNQSLEASLAMKRFHHQLQPMRIRFENGFDPEIVKYLETKGHATYVEPNSGFASLIAIGRRNGQLEVGVDMRRGGKGTIF